MKKIIKKLLKYSLCFLGIILLIGVIFGGYQFFHLKWYLKNEPLTVSELTREEKIEDFEYLTKVVEDCYPFAELIHTVKGLDNIKEMKNTFIRRAADTKDNTEFLNVFLMYLEGLRQAGHGGIQFLDHFSLYTSFAFNLPKDAFLKTNYWKSKISTLEYYVHSPLSIVYENGDYLLSKPYKRHQTEIPTGTLIRSVDDIPVDEYVKMLKYRQPLLYDHQNTKVFATRLFSVDMNLEEKYWKVDFFTPDEKSIEVKIIKYPGYQSTNNYPATSQNIVFQELNEKTLYLKIQSFGYQHIQDDHEILQSFFQQSKGKFDQLIIDLRGNTGGEITYWSENLLRPLLKEPVKLDVLTAVKKQYERRMNIHLFCYRLFTSNDLLDQTANSIVSVNKTQIDGLDKRTWNCYLIKKEFTPQNTFDFDGDVFILTNRDSLSAADSFVSAMKQLKLATVVGAPSGGWGNHYSQPWLFSLPNSGLTFQMDIELAYNADEMPTSIFGTRPNLLLNPSDYPGPIPANYEIETLLADPWIQQVMQEGPG